MWEVLKMAAEKRLIDAYALMDCIRDSKRHNPHDDPTVARNHMFEHDHFMKIVSLAPTVDAVEVAHGRWIAVPSSDMITGKAYECSECGKMRYGSFMPSYCQCCGARMDGGADNGL
jgi:rubrerythrin